MPTICAERHARELGAVFILVGTAVEGGDKHASVEFVGRRAVGRVDQHHGAAGQNVFDMEAAEIAERERQQAEFLRVRYGRAHRERCQCRAYDGVRIGGLLFRDLHVDQRREIVCLHDHKPLAITGLVGGLLADHQSAFAEVELHLLAIVHGDAVFLQHVGRENSSISGKVAGGCAATRMAESSAMSSKPTKLLLATMPAGGTRPIREAMGKIGSAACAAGAKTSQARARRQQPC